MNENKIDHYKYGDKDTGYNMEDGRIIWITDGGTLLPNRYAQWD